jgi:hypothetical protein
VIDVFQTEPLPVGDPLWTTDGIRPHMASGLPHLKPLLNRLVPISTFIGGETAQQNR